MLTISYDATGPPDVSAAPSYAMCVVNATVASAPAPDDDATRACRPRADVSPSEGERCWMFRSVR
jgi:hypothetical protein